MGIKMTQTISELFASKTDYFKNNIIVVSDTIFFRMDPAIFDEVLYENMFKLLSEARIFKFADGAGLPEVFKNAIAKEPYRRTVKANNESWTGIALDTAKLNDAKKVFEPFGLRFIEPKLGCAGFIPGVSGIFKERETVNILIQEGYPTDRAMFDLLKDQQGKGRQDAIRAMATLQYGTPVMAR